jgi:hypothetical protein
MVMLGLFKNERPLAFFGLSGAVLAVVSVAISIPVFITYLETGLVPRFPTAILSASMMLAAFLSLVCGLVLDTVTRGRREIKRLSYLQVPAPNSWALRPMPSVEPAYESHESHAVESGALS